MRRAPSLWTDAAFGITVLNVAAGGVLLIAMIVCLVLGELTAWNLLAFAGRWALLVLFTPILVLTWLATLLFARRAIDRSCLRLLVVHAVELVLILGLAWFDAFKRVSSSARPLIAAVERYVEAHGTPPQRAEELVPEYLEDLPSRATFTYSPVSYVRTGDGQRDWHLSVKNRGDAYGSSWSYEPKGWPNMPWTGPAWVPHRDSD